ncbi:EAL domain-containing protein [Candidatus Berkiella aquae]|uniref:EAL domain-containing protein n=3 Tax=Candidatus Berkiella aquae TaxID=295108 RepID=A0AAE3HYF8_9GAMM|nr:EAL domain-containing protein [Candidatus Berkiella aquae]
MMPNGYSFIMNADIFAKHSDDFITLKSDHYAVSIDAERLTDIITEPYIKIAIVTNSGQVLSTLNYTNYNLELIHKALKNPNINKITKHLLAISRVPGLYYISAESMSYVFQQSRKNLILFLPFGIIMSLIASGAVIWGLRKRLSPIGELKLAIANKEMVVYYQPILDYKTGRCCGAEALVRWQRPDGSMIKPDFFIPLAEESGLIQPITDQIIESVITNLKEILIANRDLHIAINIAVVDFNSQRIFKKLESMLSGTNIEPQQIWLEITERGFMDFKATRDNLQQIRMQGYTIVMDDFGTGYSSLSYLKELPIDVLKIDKAFVSSVDTDSVTSHVTGHIIDIAKTLNIKIVAEGVETQAQSEYLKAHHVDYAQGWLYAKAMPLEEFIKFCEFNT